jgi:hypothetical protein
VNEACGQDINPQQRIGTEEMLPQRLRQTFCVWAEK